MRGLTSLLFVVLVLMGFDLLSSAKTEYMLHKSLHTQAQHKPRTHLHKPAYARRSSEFEIIIRSVELLHKPLSGPHLFAGGLGHVIDIRIWVLNRGLGNVIGIVFGDHEKGSRKGTWKM
jgi:hypothetical protein